MKESFKIRDYDEINDDILNLFGLEVQKTRTFKPF